MYGIITSDVDVAGAVQPRCQMKLTWQSGKMERKGTDRLRSRASGCCGGAGRMCDGHEHKGDCLAVYRRGVYDKSCLL